MPTDNQKPAMAPLEWGLLVLLSVVWGGTFFFQEIAVRELPTFTIVALRVVLAATILAVGIWIGGGKLPRGYAVWRPLVIIALINNVIPFSLIVWGQKEIASGLAAILNATAPLFTVAFAHFATTDEKITGTKLIGVLVGFFGVAFLLGLDLLDGLDSAVIAQLAVLGATMFYAVSAVYGRRFREMGISPISTATGQLIASSFILVPIALAFDSPWNLPIPGNETIGALIGLASVSTALAYVLYFRILETAGATNLLLVTFLIPVSALTLGIFILGETLLPRHMVGMLCIGIGLATIDGRLFRRRGRAA